MNVSVIFCGEPIIHFFGTVENFTASAPYFLFLFSIGVATLYGKVDQIHKQLKFFKKNHLFCVALCPTGLPVLIKDQVRHQTVAGLTPTLNLARDNISFAQEAKRCSHPWG